MLSVVEGENKTSPNDSAVQAAKACNVCSQSSGARYETSVADAEGSEGSSWED